MSAPDSDSQSRRAIKRKDRRDYAVPRLQYEALVEVGAENVGGFEAESVDVSLDGMRLRTAYLPEVGETLRCRFDGFGGEIVAEAEVVWAKPEARGGEFGLKFVGLDAHALTLLNDLCDIDGAEDEEVAEDEEPEVSQEVGTRVRLHIEGLGSPMRARVRDAAQGEVLIGSNLEFLKVGRGVELEDVEHGKRRIAHIEHVGVDIDEESNVPQLVVALSYETVDAPVARGPEITEVEHGELTTAPYRTKVGARQPLPPLTAEAIEAESTPEPTVIDQSEVPEDVEGYDETPAGESRRPIETRAVVTKRAVRKVANKPLAKKAAKAETADDADDDGRMSTQHVDDLADIDEDLVMSGSRQAARRASEKVGALANKLRPAFSSISSGAKGVLGRFADSVEKRRSERKQEKDKARTPKRTTAPPPSGGLRSVGKRVLREQKPRAAEQVQAADAEPMDEEVVEPSGRKRTAVTAVLAAAAVVGIYFGASHVRGEMDVTGDEASVAAASKAAPNANANPNPNATALPAFPAPPGQADGVATANVPLFGATPLSTTEAIPAPPAPGEAADGAGATPSVDGKGGRAPASNLEMEWGVGDVEDPTVLTLRMDGPIAGIAGDETATGFTITVPSRKSVSSAAGLARKDKRIESVNVVNYPDRAEITVHFKRDVPAFMVRAKGKRLLIEIATAKRKKKRSKKKKKK